MGSLGSPLVQSCPLAPRESLEVLLIRDDERPLSSVLVGLRSGSMMQLDKTDSMGHCRFEGIEQGASVQFCLLDLDSDAWEQVTTLALRQEFVCSQAGASFDIPVPPDQEPSRAYTVKEGECLLRIGFEQGFLPETIWSHEPNTSRWGKHQRKAVLKPELSIELPPKRRHWIKGKPGYIHILHRIALPVVFSLRVLDAIGRPFISSPYVLRLKRAKGEPVPHQRGVTDANGFLHAPMLPDVVRGDVQIASPYGDREWILHLDMGTLRPADDPTGAKSRLHNLGYRFGGENGIWPVAEPLQKFQQDQPDAASSKAAEQDSTACELETSHLI